METSAQPHDRMSTSFAGPLFLVGMPRSGTKLVRQILNRHRDVHIPEIETEFLPYLADRWARFGDVSSRPRFRALYRHMQRFPYFRYRQNQGRPVQEANWYEACPDFGVAGVFEGLIRAETGLGASGAGIWGDKSPSYVRHLLLLKALYPEAKIVHIIRDVRDYCRSIQRAWGKHPVRAAFRWNQALVEASEASRNLSGDYLEMSYERLLDSPQAEVETLCRFVGIDFDSDMLNVGATTENLGDAKGIGRIVATNKGKFSSAFEDRTLRAIEEAAFTAMQIYKYPPVHATGHRPPGTIRLRLWQCLDGFNLIKSDHPNRGRFGGALFHLAYKRITRIRS